MQEVKRSFFYIACPSEMILFILSLKMVVYPKNKPKAPIKTFVRSVALV